MKIPSPGDTAPLNNQLFVLLLYCGCRMKRQMALQTRTDQHSFHNPTIQPNEELAKRGFSMYRGQDDGR